MLPNYQIKRMSSVFVSIILSVFILFSFGCSKKDDPNTKVLHIAIKQKIKGFDPIFANDGYSSKEVARVYEGLLKYHYLKRPYKLVSNLAQAMPVISNNNLRYTFTLKKGVFFQDDIAFKNGQGREMTAYDFVYSIKRLADPKLQGLGWWVLAHHLQGLDEWRERNSKRDKVDYSEEIEGLKATGKYTLEFNLTKPYPQFLYALAMPFTFVVAREVVEKYKKEFLNHPVGTGAFKLPIYNQGNKIIYTRNEKFRDEKFPCQAEGIENAKELLKNCGKKLPFVDKIIVSVLVESQPRWLNFKRGKIDWIKVPKDNFDTAIPDSKNMSAELKEKGIKLIINPAVDVTYVAFNHDNPLFNNVNLRRAMMLAYNVSKYNTLFYNDTALEAQSIIPPGVAGYQKNYKNPYRGHGSIQDIKRAKELLAKSGYPNGKGLPVITYDCASSTLSRQMGEYFKKQMSKIGINILIIQNSWPAFQKRITNRKVMLFAISWLADYPDAENFLQLLYGPNHSPGSNGSGYNDQKFNKLFKQASLMQDSRERTKLYQKLSKMVAVKVPWIFGVHRQSYVMLNSWVKNYVLTDFEQGMANYLDVDIKNKNQHQNK